MPEGHEHLDDDEKHLASLGYVQELNRSWSGFSNFAISFSIISILAGCFTSFGLGWNNGGPAAIAWGWPIVSVFILSSACVCPSWSRRTRRRAESIGGQPNSAAPRPASTPAGST